MADAGHAWQAFVLLRDPVDIYHINRSYGILTRPLSTVLLESSTP